YSGWGTSARPPSDGFASAGQRPLLGTNVGGPLGLCVCNLGLPTCAPTLRASSARRQLSSAWLFTPRARPPVSQTPFALLRATSFNRLWGTTPSPRHHLDSAVKPPPCLASWAAAAFLASY